MAPRPAPGRRAPRSTRPRDRGRRSRAHPEEPVGPQQDSDQEQEMGVERPGVGIEPESDQLGDAQRDAAEQGAPERAQAPEHYDLERDQQPLTTPARTA